PCADLVLGAGAGSGVATVADAPVSQLISRRSKPADSAGRVATIAEGAATGAGCEGVMPFTSASARVLDSCALFGDHVTGASGWVTSSKLVLISSRRGSS